jgi:hypothetical protein
MQGPGDRRRFLKFAANEGISLRFSDLLKSQVVVATLNHNVPLIKERNPKCKVVYDVVDAYYIRPNFLEDFGRGLLKSHHSQSKHKVSRFSDFVARNIASADRVVCASPEQAQHIASNFKRSATPILDYHCEYPELEFSNSKTKFRNIFWEGQNSSLDALFSVMADICETAHTNNLELKYVSDPMYYLISGQYLGIDSVKFVNFKNRRFKYPLKLKHYEWNMTNLVSAALESGLAVIPVHKKNQMARFKPENRLLISFRLGIAPLVSDTPSHKRVLNILGFSEFAVPDNQWNESLQNFLKYGDAESLVSRGKEYIGEFHNERKINQKWKEILRQLLDS